MWARFLTRLGSEVDGASLAVVRMITAAALCFLSTAMLVTGRVPDMFMQLGVRFSYPLATFVKPLPGNLPYAHMALISLTSAAVFVGWRTRLNSLLLCVAVVYWFLLEPLYYTDGYYLLVLMSILTAWLPVNRWMSADRQLKRETRTRVQYWQVWLVQMQLLCVYFFSGLSKLNGDWLSGAPLVERLADAGIGTAAHYGVAIAWSVMLFQLLIGFVLLWRRSRAPGLVLMSLFHAVDFFWLEIGVAPLLVWSLSFIFCDPAWPRPLVDRMAPALLRLPGSNAAWLSLRRLGSAVDSAFAWFDDSPIFKRRSPARKPLAQMKGQTDRHAQETSELTRYCIVAWLAVQIVLPLRYLAYPGNPRWTNDGRLFAWRGQTRELKTELKLSLLQQDRELLWSLNPKDEFPVPLQVIYTDEELAQRNLTGGMLQDIVMANDDELVNMRIKAANLSDADVRRLQAASLVIAKLQLSQFEFREMSRRPELLRQYCEFAAQTVGELVPARPRVLAEMYASLNHRNWTRLVPDESELSEERFSMAPFSWIVPLEESLPAAEQRLAFLQEHKGDREFDTFESAPAGDGPKESEADLAPGISDEDEQWFQSAFAETASGED